MVLLVSKTAPPLQIPGHAPSRKGSATKITKSFLDKRPTKNILATFATHEKLKLLFVKYNTALPSNAGLERPFLTGKTLSGPKKQDYQTSISTC